MSAATRGAYDEGSYRRESDWSIQLRPRPRGCGWVQISPTWKTPSCPEPPAYALTSPHFVEEEGQACVEHTALMRELHPEWIARVMSLTGGSPAERDSASAANSDPAAVDGGAA
jgi:hypothetical protein